MATWDRENARFIYNDSEAPTEDDKLKRLVYEVELLSVIAQFIERAEKHPGLSPANFLINAVTKIGWEFVPPPLSRQPFSTETTEQSQ